MCEQYQAGIEHPNQDTWLQGYSVVFSAQQKQALADRYADQVPGSVDINSLASAIDVATMINYSYRATHESGNRALLGVGSKHEHGDNLILRQQYDEMTGRPKKIGHFIQWFSRVSHDAFVKQEVLPAHERFKHVSLELGGIRQFGDWESTAALDAMARSVPQKVLEANPKAHLILYGRRSNEYNDARVDYVDEVNKTYRLLPQYKLPAAEDKQFKASAFDDEDLEKSAPIAFDFTVVRRRRPVADIYIPGQSDLVIFKESIGLMVMSMIESEARESIIDDCKRVFNEARLTRDIKGVGAVKMNDTPGARLAGGIFEAAIDSRAGVTKDIIPISAHYVQAVGEKYAALRHAA